MSVAPVTVDVFTLPQLLLPDAKLHMRVDFAFDDALIADLLARSIAYWEAQGDGLKINPGQWIWSPDSTEFCNGQALIPITPINNIAVTIPDPADPLAPPLDVAADYVVATSYSSGAIRWSLVGGFQSGLIATIDTGYADPLLIPADLRSHIFERTTRTYEYRSSIVDGSPVLMPEWKTFDFAPFWNPKA